MTGSQTNTADQKFETGLDYFRARYYSGAQGRFTSPDPMFFQVEMLADPQRFNLYAYARNNPLRFIDPTGETIELSSDPTQRGKEMAALCVTVGTDACKHLYVDDKFQKGHYYVVSIPEALAERALPSRASIRWLRRST
ncbi:MAG: RHS repeat-associated core domain-containing protein [Bryobacterales bacterium]|nr:RHS repeat-associated core domain-containing protein [Bryobacterales bacterium]